MHIKAIQIKEQLLGQEDYEVALSVGHLASLYNYDMNQYEDAERLYLRSIAIGKRQLASVNLLSEILASFSHSHNPYHHTPPPPGVCLHTSNVCPLIWSFPLFLMQARSCLGKATVDWSMTTGV